jgi:hypothetical protein
MLPRYVHEALAALQGKFAPSSLHVAVVAHDDNCNIWQHRPCNCEPKVDVKPVAKKRDADGLIQS